MRSRGREGCCGERRAGTRRKGRHYANGELWERGLLGRGEEEEERNPLTQRVLALCEGLTRRGGGEQRLPFPQAEKTRRGRTSLFFNKRETRLRPHPF